MSASVRNLLVSRMPCLRCHRIRPLESAVRRLCGSCYSTLRRQGPLAPVTWEALLVDWRQVTDSGCWQWLGALNSNGYGIRAGQYAHRKSYELHVGPIPSGLQIDHLCRNRGCFNPDHLEAVTPSDNVRRGVSPSAIAVRTNRCKWGHELTPDNVYVRRDTGSRQCRECHRRRGRERKAREAVA